MLDRTKFDCQDEHGHEDDPMGQLLQTIVTAAEALEKSVELGKPFRSKNLERLAHRKEIKWLSHAATQIQFVASNADIRRIALEEIASEDDR